MKYSEYTGWGLYDLGYVPRQLTTNHEERKLREIVNALKWNLAHQRESAVFSNVRHVWMNYNRVHHYSAEWIEYIPETK